MDLRKAAFRAWFRISRPMRLGVRAIVENDAGKVLLVRHTYVRGLFLPGGGVERGEPAQDALMRELVEEAGVELAGAPELLGIYSNHRVFRNDHVLLYRIRNWRAVEATSRGEIAEIIWTDPLALPSDATPGTKRRLAAVFGGGDASLYW
ncbi:MAG: NUDIX domain-containing protein [Hyphomonadaceae bacterium]